jgi:hypothetical protein
MACLAYFSTVYAILSAGVLTESVEILGWVQNLCPWDIHKIHGSNMGARTKANEVQPYPFCYWFARR